MGEQSEQQMYAYAFYRIELARNKGAKTEERTPQIGDSNKLRGHRTAGNTIGITIESARITCCELNDQFM